MNRGRNRVAEERLTVLASFSILKVVSKFIFTLARLTESFFCCYVVIGATAMLIGTTGMSRG